MTLKRKIYKYSNFHSNGIEGLSIVRGTEIRDGTGLQFLTVMILSLYIEN